MHADSQSVVCIFYKRGVWDSKQRQTKHWQGIRVKNPYSTVETKRHYHQRIQVSLSATATEEDAAPNFVAQVDWEWLPHRSLQLFVWQVGGQV